MIKLFFPILLIISSIFTVPSTVYAYRYLAPAGISEIPLYNSRISLIKVESHKRAMRELQTSRERIQYFKRVYALTLMEYCVLTGIDKGPLSKYLNGKRKPSNDDMRRIAQAFGLEDLFYIRDGRPYGEVRDSTYLFYNRLKLILLFKDSSKKEITYALTSAGIKGNIPQWRDRVSFPSRDAIHKIADILRIDEEELTTLDIRVHRAEQLSDRMRVIREDLGWSIDECAKRFGLMS